MPGKNSDTFGYSPDAVAQRQEDVFAMLRQVAPEAISDNQVDIDRLKDLLGQDRMAPAAEHYELSWAGKSAARREIQKSTSHTLLPKPGNPEHAQHMLIEGENLEVLRVLQKSYYGKIKMIYIDPPYNTGNDSFVYPDDYSETLDQYQRRTGEKDESGRLNKQSLWKKNSKENGQYHSAWLSMMYPRLYLARNLLRDDGVIFISIDDNEAANLKLMCDEIFGEENFLAQIIWKKRSTPPNDQVIAAQHEYILCFSKNIKTVSINLRKRTDKQVARYRNPDKHNKGPWAPGDLMGNIKGGRYVESLHFAITNPRTGQKHFPSSNGNWRFNKDKIDLLLKNNEIYFGDDDQGRPKLKRFLADVKEGITWTTLWDFVPLNTAGSAEMTEIFGNLATFENPKPTGLLIELLKAGSSNNDIILDFFAGSGTTAQAVMELNLEDSRVGGGGGGRTCICVQMPELLDPASEAYKAGYRTIADITRARIEKVIEKLKAEHPDQTADLACAHFTLARSNFQVWQGDLADAEAIRAQLELFQHAEKDNSELEIPTERALLSELLLKHGLGALGVHAITRPKTVAGVTIHRVLLPDNQTMWLCFEPYSEALKDAIVKERPVQVTLLNSCFTGDKADEQLSNLQLELAGLDIGLLVI